MKRADKLLKKYNLGTATPEERSIIDNWYVNYKTEGPDLISDDLKNERVMGLERLRYALRKNKVRQLWWPISIAASLLLFAGIGWLWMQHSDNYIVKDVPELLLPETNSLTLTLANGKKITLSEEDTGKIIIEGNTRISLARDGLHLSSINAIITEDNVLDSYGYNTLKTPRGSQYQIILPDGSKVMLSSSSALKYPVNFLRHDRKVELIGQAYFEVVPAYLNPAGFHSSRSAKIPFIVKAGNQEVKVLGTQFNVDAYDDNENIETALLEGSVKVSITGAKAEVNLKPGEKAINSMHGSGFRVETFDLEDLRAWKEGYFVFNNENIKDIMRKLSRWYGFDTDYVGDMTDIAFQGNFKRTRDVKYLFKMMEMTNKIKFDIQYKNNERRVVVKRVNQ